jgi:hypothetical protein
MVYLNLTYGNQWISTADSVPWPSRCHDLGLFLCGFMKEIAYKQMIIELTCNIIQVSIKTGFNFI